MQFSENDTNSFQLFFDLRAKKEYAKAILILKKLNKSNKNNSVISGLLGTIYFESGDYTKSKHYFKKAAILNEKSELSSLGLFHTLNILDCEILALKELDRFVKTNKPIKYKKIIADLKKSIRTSSNKRRNKIIAEILLKVTG